MPVRRFQDRSTSTYVQALEWTGDNSAEMADFAGDIFDEVDGYAELLFGIFGSWRLRTGHWVVSEERGLAVRTAQDFAAKYVEK